MTANEKSEFERLKYDVRRLFGDMKNGRRFEVLEERSSSLEKILAELAETVKELEVASKRFAEDIYKADFNGMREKVRGGTDIEIQTKRSKLFRDSVEEEDQNECERLSRELRECPVVFADKGIQYLLDSFDYDYVVEIAARLGFTVGQSEAPVCKTQLIKDAIESFTELLEVKSGRIQRGRLVVNKFCSELYPEGWYTMDYSLEHCEDYSEVD